jgi:1,4-alpha-glucan branching enzyme
MKKPGALAVVLHTHMPYVEGFGTWPFGEEWLWEAVATSYVPLLDRVLGRAPLTLSLTPVLCDQLEAPGAMARCISFLEEIRPESHRRDIVGFRDGGHEEFASELERSAAEYTVAAERLRGLEAPGPAGLLDALGAHASWTSSATHAVLPLLASDAGVALQVQTGIESHRRRFGEWGGGFWLPECAHAPWLDPLVEEAGVRATCVELTNLLGLGDDRHLRPLISDDGPVLWPIDRAAISLVWSEHGYPAGAAYRNHHGLTTHHHRVWSNAGGVYDPEAASAQVAIDAADFVTRVRDRVSGGGVCVFALDTELLGHWWYEGVGWLEAVLEEAAREGLELISLDEALERYEPVPAPVDLPVTSWGQGGDLRTWSGPSVAGVAWSARTAELRLLRMSDRVGERAVRELLALQSSDWAFLVSRGGAGEYPLERLAGHREALESALSDAGADPTLRGLAPVLSGRLD